MQILPPYPKISKQSNVQSHLTALPGPAMEQKEKETKRLLGGSGRVLSGHALRGNHTDTFTVIASTTIQHRKTMI